MVNSAGIKELSDLDLIKMAKAGNHFAFKEIVKRYKSKIAGVIFGMLGRCVEADDIGQEVFIRFYGSLDKFRGESALGTYLTRIAINLSLNEIKRRKRKIILSLDNYQEKGNDIAESERALLSGESREIINNALHKLGPKYRSVLVLRLIEGYSTEETANILELPFGTVLSRLARGQKKLKELLTPYGDIL